MTKNKSIGNFRKPENKINSLILERWSSRALSSESISAEELLSLFEAAKWAPSAFNNQPWRFIYVQNNTPLWNKFFSLLVEFNQTWVNRAAVLILVISSQIFEHNGQPSATSSFDTGAACQNIALEAENLGLVAHIMSGFDYERARTEFNIPGNYKIEVMIAIGRPGDKSYLPEKMQSVENPSNRKKIAELISEGEFRF